MQSMLASYYLVGLIPYVFYFDNSDQRLECTLAEMDIHALRRYCLQTFTERLIAMPEFWWTFQRYQPIRPSALGEQFADVHPLGFDDAMNRLIILNSLGASQKLSNGRYCLTSLGEELADQWKRFPTLSPSVDKVQEQAISHENDLDLIDLTVC